MLVLVTYLAALAVTVGLRDDHVRPLYDGFATPAPYRWVDPPAFFASDNVTPAATTTTIALASGGSAAAGIATPDGQFVLSLARGAVAPRGGQRHVLVRITPVDPNQLAAVPAGRPNGNAYRVEMSYQPGGAAVRALARPGSLVMEIPEIGSDLFTSPSGRRWSKLDARTVPPRQLGLATTFASPGYYVAATNLPELVAATASSSDHSIAIGIATAAGALALLVVAFLYARRRRRRAI